MSELFKDLVIDSESPSGLRWADTKKYNLADKPAGYQRKDGYWEVRIDGELYLAHRVIMSIHLGRMLVATEIVDHINMTRWDNRVENLRVCSVSDNLCNRYAPQNSTTKVKGVTLNKKTGKYNVACTKNRVVHWGGSFDNLEDAISASKKLREELHGQYARF